MKNSKTIHKVMIAVHRSTPGLFPLMLMTKMLAAAEPFISIVFSARILDLLANRGGAKEIIYNVLMMIGLGAGASIVRWGLEMLCNVRRTTLNRRIEQLLCNKSFELDYDILERKETMEMLAKAQDGVQSNGNIAGFCEMLADVFERIFTIVYSVILLVSLFIPAATQEQGVVVRFLNQWYSMFILLAVIGVTLWITFRNNRYSGDIHKQAFDENVKDNRRFGYFFSFVEDYAQGKNVRLYKMQDMIMEEIDKAHDNMERMNNWVIRKLRRVVASEKGCSFLLQLTSYIFIGLKAVFGLITVGGALKYINAYHNLVQATGSMLSIFVRLGINSQYLAYYYDYLEIRNKRYEGTIPTEKRDDNEFIVEFRDVSFHYPNSEELVLSHVSEKFALGSKMAVVGKNGAGKTTFIKLLTRMYEPTEGEILLNGVNIQYYDYKEYIRLFSVVFQDFSLFSFSIAENVAANTEYDSERVQNCVEKAGLKSRIAKMPEGIHTNLYQMQKDGIEVSGGEAQKLAIARALYKDAPWVILDEPTSALDPISEYEIYSHFAELVKDKTAIYISHRMSSCRFCDVIYVFDNGRIVQKGSHDELVTETTGLYSRMWKAQAQYYQV